MNKKNIKDISYWCFDGSVGRKGHINQDYSLCYLDDNYDYAVAITCDGHGCNKHFRSDKGAQLAAKAALQTIKTKYDNQKYAKSKKDVNKLSEDILKEWRGKVRKHFTDNPPNKDEMSIAMKYKIKNPYIFYGTTISIAVVSKNHWFAIKCGDGEVFKYGIKKGKIIASKPIYEKGEFANYTKSLCNSNVNFLNYYEKITKKSDFLALMTVTDGIINSIDENQIDKFIIDIIKCQAKDCEKHKTENDKDLNNYLQKISDNGCLDDVSLAAIYCDNLFKYNVET